VNTCLVSDTKRVADLGREICPVRGQLAVETVELKGSYLISYK
jgi:hypothetical protein